jgi:hypothetical protein
MATKKNYPELFEVNTLRAEYGGRGGGIEISLDFVGKKYKGHKMTAYQNYLGGGILGRINSDCTFKDWQGDDKLNEVSEELKKYFHSLTNPEEGEWESMSYEKNQMLPTSAY